MSKKPRLGHDPFSEEPLTFIRDTRGEAPKGKSRTPAGPGKNIRNIGNIENTKISRDSIFKPGPRRGRPRGTGAKDPANWKRATFILNRETLAKLKARAYRDRLTVTDALNQALDAYLKGKTVRSK